MDTHIKTGAFVALLALSAPAGAQLPPASYQGDLGERLLSGFSCLGKTFRQPELIVLPRFVGGDHLRAGEWMDPTTCQKGGRPAGPQF